MKECSDNRKELVIKYVYEFDYERLIHYKYDDVFEAYKLFGSPSSFKEWEV